MLEPLAQQLVTVEIKGRKVDVPWRFAGIANRVKQNNGALFTAEDVSPLDRTRDVFLSLPGVHVNDRSLTFARCQDSGRLPGFFDKPDDRAAKVQLYIDGVHINIDDVSSAIDGVNPASVQVIEVYTGIGRIPAAAHPYRHIAFGIITCTPTFPSTSSVTSTSHATLVSMYASS